MLQLSEDEWLIIIGNEDGSINGTPSNQYASLLNNSKTITFKGYVKANRHYHWVNKVIENWANIYGVQMTIEMEDDD